MYCSYRRRRNLPPSFPLLPSVQILSSRYDRRRHMQGEDVRLWTLDVRLPEEVLLGLRSEVCSLSLRRRRPHPVYPVYPCFALHLV